MDLRQLRYFVTVAEELHFGRAAERLGMTQPPLSQSIAALEQELGLRLFERTKRTVALTSVGAQWLTYVRDLLGRATELPAIAQQLQRGEIGSLTLAFVTTADYSLMPQLVSRYTRAYPDVQVLLREATSDVQIEALLRQEIDAGLIIAPEGAALHATLGYHPLLREALVLAVPEDWVTNGRLGADHVRLTEVIDEPLIIFPRRSAPAFHDIITGYYTRNGAEPCIVQEAIQTQTIIALVSAGMGVALVPRSLRNLARAGVRYLDFEGDPPEIETGLVWRKRGATAALERFVELAVGKSRR